jgi:hypothetical protein
MRSLTSAFRSGCRLAFCHSPQRFHGFHATLTAFRLFSSRKPEI